MGGEAWHQVAGVCVCSHLTTQEAQKEPAGTLALNEAVTPQTTPAAYFLQQDSVF